MLNEQQEFLSYTSIPVYASKNKQDYSYLGRIAFATIFDFEGFPRILSIIARGYMHSGALPISTEHTERYVRGAVFPIKKKMPPVKSGNIKVIFVSYMASSPNL